MMLMTTMQMGFGGAETHIYELCRALIKNGHTVTLASAGGKDAEMLEKSGGRHVTLPLASKNPASVIKAYFGLKKLIKKGYVQLLASDAHGAQERPPVLKNGIESVPKFSAVLSENSIKVIRNELI